MVTNLPTASERTAFPQEVQLLADIEAFCRSLNERYGDSAPEQFHREANRIIATMDQEALKAVAENLLSDV